jgi:two-component sensor histidine kinase
MSRQRSKCKEISEQTTGDQIERRLERLRTRFKRCMQTRDRFAVNEYLEMVYRFYSGLRERKIARKTARTIEGRKSVGRARHSILKRANPWNALDTFNQPHERQARELHFLDLLARLAGDYLERKRHEQHIQFLLNEVNRRSKNMLALVQAIARQSAPTAPQDFINHFEDRLRALAASHDLLVGNDWKGVNLRDLARSQLQHFNGLMASRIELHGPDVFVSGSAAQSLGMALHELATNAGKYGALSSAAGKVSLVWDII